MATSTTTLSKSSPTSQTNSPAKAVQKPANPLIHWLFSSIGKKTIVALTGIALVLFLIVHLLGNLTIFLGPDVMNAYAEKLESMGSLLWIARIGLLITVGLHIFFTMLLWKENSAARPQKYQHKAHVQSTVFVRTMRMSGLIVLAFICFHLAHFTLDLIDPSYATLTTTLHGETVHDVYRMVILGFSVPWVSAFYVLSLAFIAFHLSHGLASLFQTLGFTNQTLRKHWERYGRALAWLLFIGYASIPTSVLLFKLGQ